MFTHVKKLNSGAQGVVGIVEYPNHTKAVYKISNTLNYLAEHEAVIMKSLLDLSSYCPHFCKILDYKILPIHPKFREEDQNPFEEYSKGGLQLGVVFMEYIPKSVTLLDLIETKDIPFPVLLSLIKQTLISIVIAQRDKQLVHNDLHSMNILIRKCPVNLVYVYKLADDHSVYVPTYGFHAVIIDYGFSAIKDLTRLSCSLSYTDAGYLSPAYDPVADTRRLFVSMATDLKEFRSDCPEATTFRNIAKNIFGSLSLDWTNGWEMLGDIPLTDYIFDYLENDREKSELFNEYPHYAMDILQGLIQVPLTVIVEPDLKEMRRAYTSFVKEFNKIEREINNTFFSLYFLRVIVNLLEEYKASFLSESSRQNAVQEFKQKLFTLVNEQIPFCTLETVKFPLLMCSCYVFIDYLQSKLTYMLEDLMSHKRKKYKQLPMTSPIEMLGCLEFCFQDDHQIKNPKYKVYDTLEKRNYILTDV